MRIQKTEGLQAFLETPKNIVITNHINPDGDAMGSALGLKLYLEKLGHTATVLVPNEYPVFLHWLPQNKSVVIYKNQQQKGDALLKDADLIFSLDYNALSRCGGLQESLASSKAKKAMIDHHQQPEEFVDWMISDTSKCSTAQMVYEFIEEFNHLELLDVNIANALYVGILTDTGSFRFSSTTEKTHQIVAHLLGLGVKPDQIYNHVFDANSVSRLKLLGTMLEQMIVYPEKKAAILFLSHAQLKKIGFKKGDSEGFVNYGLSISGIHFSAFLREEDGNIKMSFRSKGEVDVNVLARKYINGGGHKNAAGGLLEMNLEKGLAHIKNMINTEL